MESAASSTPLTSWNSQKNNRFENKSEIAEIFYFEFARGLAVVSQSP